MRKMAEVYGKKSLGQISDEDPQFEDSLYPTAANYSCIWEQRVVLSFILAGIVVWSAIVHIWETSTQ